MDLIFDRKLLALNVLRSVKHFPNHNFLHHEIANRIDENLQSLAKKFELVLEIGARDDYLKELVLASCGNDYFFCESEESFAQENRKFDAILSNLNLQFVNEIPQFLLQVKEALKPEGIFIASFFGEENLHELAHVLFQTENEIYGGVSPRMPPTIDVKTAANLLAHAGFKNPISDFEKIEVTYKDPLSLLKDLKFMGLGSSLHKRSRRFFSKKFLTKILENYQNLYSTADGTVRATFEIVTITGWK